MLRPGMLVCSVFERMAGRRVDDSPAVRSASGRRGADRLTGRTVEIWSDMVRRATPVYSVEALSWAAQQLALASGTADERRAAALTLYDVGLDIGLAPRMVAITMMAGFSEALWPTD